ncbi:venom allergen 3-like [Scaptodrosophila lebanonensis]|uniref:Venom allergen-1 n=1 Tax=Drosophila lebanonensis TaxID=7225 RepID=A0A6J2UHP8_DROLE|nr:venom allergen 3-like [Scaptodrosophila lebanonensis]
MTQLWNMLLHFLLLTLLVALIAAQTNYCDPEWCRRGSRHIACNNNGSWHAACPTRPAPVLVPMTLGLRRLILRAHNTRRNQLAGGNLRGFPSALRMATMLWDEELARLADLNVRQCTMEHDDCHNTPRFRASGQNLAYIAYPGRRRARSDAQLSAQCIAMWWNEHRGATIAQINRYPEISARVIGHFTAMAQMNNTHCGCAAARYLRNRRNVYLFACNYATTNWIGRPVYVAGRRASACSTGRNINFPALCSLAEVYSV